MLNPENSGLSLASWMPELPKFGSGLPTAHNQTSNSPRRLSEAEDVEGSTAISAATRYQKAESFSLELQTKEGDKVTVRFGYRLDQTETYQANRSEQQRSSYFELSRQEKSHFQFQVEGNLNEDELDAINNLIRDVGQISNDFFNGDFQQAFDQASEFKLDKSQLASMALHLKRTETSSAATAYQQVKNLPEFETNLPKGLQHAASVMERSQQNPLLSFTDSLRSFQLELLDQLVKQDSRFQEKNAQEKDISSKLEQFKQFLAA